MHYKHQREFASILYDTLFGLILFFGLDSFLELQSIEHFFFYAFANIIVVHWWLLYKSAADLFQETRTSAIHILFNLLFIVLLEFVVLFAGRFEFVTATLLLMGILFGDLLWAIAVKHAHTWRTKKKKALRLAQKELKMIIQSNTGIILLFALLVGVSPFLQPALFVGVFIAIYILYIVLSFVLKIIDLDIF